MKTRQSHVSNSSSSSFLLIGIPVASTGIPNLNVENDDIWAIGTFLSEGLDVFLIQDKKMLQFIIDFPSSFSVFRNAEVYYEEARIPVSGLDNKDEHIITFGMADQNHSCDIETMVQHYETIIERKAKKIIQKNKEEIIGKYI